MASCGGFLAGEFDAPPLPPPGTRTGLVRSGVPAGCDDPEQGRHDDVREALAGEDPEIGRAHV